MRRSAHFFVVGLCLFVASVAVLPSSAKAGDEDNDLLFIHHSCGSNWLSDGLEPALLAKSYIDERNDITYGTDLSPNVARPDSLAGTPGNSTDMNHWILWFNDYADGVRSHGCADGFNNIVMFKSCYPISNVYADTGAGDPFESYRSVANYQSVYAHPVGPGNTYSNGGYTYQPLEDIFAANTDTLFIPVTAPPRHYAPSDATNDDEAHRARVFNDWLKNDWLSSYDTVNPGLNNVAVFDWFDVLAYADDDPSHPNRLKSEYGGTAGNSHPNLAANTYSTEVFATNTANFIDDAWNQFSDSNIDAIWNPGTGNWSNAGNWQGGTVPDNSGGNLYNVYIDGGDATESVVTLDLQVAVSNLTVNSGDHLLLTPAGSLTVQGGTGDGQIVNNGKIVVGDATSWPTLKVSGTVTLSGSGDTILDGINASIVSLATGDQLTNMAGHTIRGYGDIGAGTGLDLVNRGCIVADSAGNTLHVSPGFGHSNEGTMTAQDGGILDLRVCNINIDNTGGIIEALDGSEVNIHGTPTGIITGGELTTSGSGRVTFEECTLKDLTNSGTLSSVNVAYLQGTITNNGEINLGLADLSTELRLLGQVTLAGSGEMVLTSYTADIRSYGSEGHLINEAGHTISGWGNIGHFEPMRLTNRGIIVADSDGAHLNVMAAIGSVNEGTMTAQNGGILEMGVCNFDNTGGVIQALEGSEVMIMSDDPANILHGGELATTGTGKVSFQDCTLKDFTNSGHLNVENIACLAGTITNNGEITVNAVGANTTQLGMVDDVTLTGTGSLVLSGQQARIAASDGTDDSLTNEAGHTISGWGEIGAQTTLSIINKGLIAANHAGQGLVLNPQSLDNEGVIEVSSGCWMEAKEITFNSGVIRASGEASYIELQTIEDNTDGLIEALDGGEITIMGNGPGYVVRGGELNTSGTGLITAGYQMSLEEITNRGLLEVWDDLYMDGEIADTGTVRNAGNIIVQTRSLNVNGQIIDRVGSGGEINIENGATMNIAGTIQGTNQRIYLGGNSAGPGTVNQSTGSTVEVEFVEIIDGTYSLTGGSLTANSVRVQDALQLGDASVEIAVRDDIDFDSSATLNAVSGATIRLLGADFQNNSTSPSSMADMANITLICDAPESQGCVIEVAGADVGAVAAGWVDNFALAMLQLGGDDAARTRLTDGFDNQVNGLDDALYVGEIVINPGAYIDLNDLKLYYLNGGDPKQLFIGDSNLDGAVNLLDLGAMADNWGDSVSVGWAEGDFDGSGQVNLLDLGILADGWGNVGTTGVPEPATFSIMLAAGLPILLKRRRSRG